MNRIFALAMISSVAPAAVAAQGIIVSAPVFWSHCAARLSLKAERTADPAAAAELERAAAAALARAKSLPSPEGHMPAQLEGFAREMGAFLRERLAANPAIAATLDRSVAQCQAGLAQPAE